MKRKLVDESTQSDMSGYLLFSPNPDQDTSTPSNAPDESRPEPKNSHHVPSADAKRLVEQPRKSQMPKPRYETPVPLADDYPLFLAVMDKESDHATTTNAASAAAQPETAGSTAHPSATAAALAGHPICPATTEPPDTSDEPPTPPTSQRGKRPRNKSLLTITTGAEPMQARAFELYSALTILAFVPEFEVRSPGPPISLDGVSVDAIKAHYLAMEPEYQKTLGARTESLGTC